MINEKIENFLEKADMNYLFCLLAQLEASRLLQFPTYVKQKFPDKIAVLAMNHVAENEVPDYISELAEAELLEAELAAQKQENPFLGEEMSEEEAEETIDDSERFIEDLGGSDDFDKDEDKDEDEDEDEDEEDDFYDDDNDNDDDL
ncbi:MAG: hypothetical protein ABFC98_01285 [Candidatus Cloacimonas sp.]